MTPLAFVNGTPIRLLFSSTAVAVTSRRRWVPAVRPRHAPGATRIMMNGGSSSNNGRKEDGVANIDDVQGSFAWDVSMGHVLSGIFATAIAGIPAAALAEVPPALKEAFKSKPASLAHPATMWLLFAGVLYTGYLGWQSRSIRSAEPDKRKELVKSKVTKRHFENSSAIFAIMTVATFSGMANTYTRTGKLFPGPHLYAGLGLVALMATMSALVPQMQAGKLWAKNTHFTLALPTVLLFAWQAKSGMAIVGKLLGWA